MKGPFVATTTTAPRFIAIEAVSLQFFNSQGYLVIESFSSSEEVEALRKRMDQLLDGFDCSSSTSIFSTKNQQRTSDDYFYDSADKISFFFEGSFMPYLEHMIQFFVFYVLIFSNYLTEKAFDDDGNLKQPKQLSINKVGHAIEDLFQVLSIKSLTELEGTSQDGGTEVQVSTFAGNF
ncbi:hypothetical protein LXL04_019838 [Taraxacum kok-saghyz]